MPVVLAGAIVNGKPNFMTVGWITRCSHNPPRLAMGINKAHHTPAGILEHGEFSICQPRRDMVELTDWCGIVSGRRTDKAAPFTIQYGTLAHAPLIAECPLCIECRLVQTVDQPHHHIFIGEIVAARCCPDCLTGGKPDTSKLDPLLLTMPENRYYRLGGTVGDAWSLGKALKPSQGKATESSAG